MNYTKMIFWQLPFQQIRRQKAVSHTTLNMLYTPVYDDAEENAQVLEQAFLDVCQQIEKAARANAPIGYTEMIERERQ